MGLRRNRGKPFVVPVTVEFEDVDSYGIAHHTKLVAYLERARVRLFTEAGIDLGRDRVLPVLSQLTMRYRAPVLMLDQIEVEVYVEALDEYSLTLAYRLRREGCTVAHAETVLAFTDLDDPGIRPLPEVFAAGLRPYLPPAPAPDA